jgi:hypothetical protein
MPGLKGGRGLTTTQVAKLLSSGRNWLQEWTGKVPAKLNFYHGGRLCCSKNVGARSIGVGSLSLRGARFLPYDRNRLRNLGGESNEIAAPRLVGARNDKNAWCWTKEAATRSWRRDLQTPVSSLFYGFMATATEAASDLSCCLVSAADRGSPSLRGTIVPKQSRRGMRLPRPFSGARNDRSAGGFSPEPQSGGRWV